jgi:DNA-binding MurR/RpiR family transcriptional regulator
MSFREVIEQYDGRLTAADKRLVHELLSNPTEGAFLSAANLADRVGVHSAAAVRLARKLGFSGYPELRAQLQSQLMAESGPADRLRHRLAHIDHETVLDALVRSEITALRELDQHVSQARLDDAAEALIRARKVFLFGHGHAVAIVELMQRRLRRSGLDVVKLIGPGRELAERILPLGPDDAFLAFAFHSVPPGLITLMKHSRKAGATTVFISDLIGPLVRPKPDILLAAPRGGMAEEFQTSTVPTLICNALVLTIARLDEGRSLRSLEQLNSLIEAFDP